MESDCLEVVYYSSLFSVTRLLQHQGLSRAEWFSLYTPQQNFCPKLSEPAEASLLTSIKPEIAANKKMPKPPYFRRGYLLLRSYSRFRTPNQSRLVATFYLFLGVTLPFIPPALESARYRNADLNKHGSEGDIGLLQYIFLGPDMI